MKDFEICDTIDKCLHRLNSTSKIDDTLAVATSRLHIKTMPLQQNIYCFDQSESIGSYLNTFLIRSEFRHKSAFNDVLQQVVSAGLVSRWEKQYLYRVTKPDESSEGLLTEDFLFICMAFISHVAFTVLALFAEIIIFKKVNSMNSNKFWKFWDKVMCGRRRFFLLSPRKNDAEKPAIIQRSSSDCGMNVTLQSQQMRRRSV